MVEKVILFITRTLEETTQLLVKEQPGEGVQLVGGIIQDHEMPLEASHRIGFEHTRLNDLELVYQIREESGRLTMKEGLIKQDGHVYAKAGYDSDAWAQLPKGVKVDIIEEMDNFCHIDYVEFDHEENPDSISFRVKGWIPKHMLTADYKVHYYHFQSQTEKDIWDVGEGENRSTMKWIDLKETYALNLKHQLYYDAVEDHFEDMMVIEEGS